MATGGDLVINDNIQVGKFLKIVARGLTPNHVFRQIRTDQFEGMLWRFEHFNKTTVVLVQLGETNILDEFDLNHMDIVEVEA